MSLLSSYQDPGSFRYNMRVRRLKRLMAMIELANQKTGRAQIIDIGGTAQYWRLVPAEFLESRNVTVTIVNIPGSALPPNSERFTYVTADGCDLSMFESQSFDIAHSNSVVEHVGDWSRMKAFASEVKRVGRSYFVQTPNYWFPVEPHCMTPLIHWLPKPTRLWLVMQFRLGHWQRAGSVDHGMTIIESARLLTGRMFKALFDDAEVVTERLLLLPKSFAAINDTKLR